MDSNELRKKMTKGDISKIAKRVKRHRNWVRMVLQGKYQDIKVLKETLALLKEREEEKARISREISEFVSAVKN